MNRNLCIGGYGRSRGWSWDCSLEVRARWSLVLHVWDGREHRSAEQARSALVITVLLYWCPFWKLERSVVIQSDPVVEMLSAGRVPGSDDE